MKTFLCVVRRVLAVLLALIFALLGAACLIAIPLSNNYSAMVSMAIAMPTTAKSGGSNPQYFTSDYSSAEAVQEASAQLCREIEQEGMVLLRNNGDALPLAKGASVTLLGESAADLVYGGAGAGSVDTSTAPNLRQALLSTRCCGTSTPPARVPLIRRKCPALPGKAALQPTRLRRAPTRRLNLTAWRSTMMLQS